MDTPLVECPERTISTIVPMTAPAPRRVLVIHPGALGDVLQAVPALRALAALDGGARVRLAAQPRLGAFLAGAGVVDESLSFESAGLSELFTDGPLPAALRDQLSRYDDIVSWFGARASPYPERLREVAPRAVLSLPVPDAGMPGPVWLHLLSTLAPLGARTADDDTDALVGPLGLPRAWRARARTTLAALGVGLDRPLLLVHPGAGSRSKRWPAERFARSITLAAPAARAAVVVHEGPADREAVAALYAQLASTETALDATRLRDPDLPLLAGVLAEAHAYLGGDSGVSHLAAAAGAPAFIAFADDKRETWAPWSPRAATMGPDDDWAAPLRSALTAGTRPPI